MIVVRDFSVVFFYCINEVKMNMYYIENVWVFVLF